MAENTDAEIAFLQSMQSGETAAAGDAQQNEQEAAADESGDESDYDPSSLMPEASAPDTKASGDASLEAPSRSESRLSNTKPTPAPISTKPRTVGGFAVDSSDEDGSPVTQSAAAGANGHLDVAQAAAKPAESLTQSPKNSTPLPDVPIYSAAQDQGASGVVPPTSASSLAVPTSAAVPPDTGASTPFANPTPTVPTPSQNNVAASTPVPVTAGILPKVRLPNDRIGILEDRIAEDPRGDMDAWLELINEYRRRNKVEEARNAYDRFFKVFPHAAEQWVAYTKMETDADAMYQVEQIFRRCLLEVPHVKLWSTYLDYVRRTNNINTDTTGNARKTVLQAFDFVLKNVGIDRDSGYLWQDYINFIKSGPGTIGGTGWQDAQKMDDLRKAYQRAVVVPTRATNTIWLEYSTFENNLNKMTAKKFLTERSPAFVQARSSAIAMANFTAGLDRTTLPRLPPAPGYDGEVDYTKQVSMWKYWIEWEKDDPLAIKDEDFDLYKARIVFVYKQALMALRFWPEMWYEAAEFCFQNGLEEQGTSFLRDGAAANPESLLLAFKTADRAEVTSTASSDEEQIKARGEMVRKPFDDVLDALYNLYKKAEVREKQATARAKEAAESEAPLPLPIKQATEDDDEEQEDGETSGEKILEQKIEAIKKAAQEEYDLLKDMISAAWIGLMRAMRRVQGQGTGKQGAMVGGFRKVFQDARAKGRLTSKVYVASALIEYHCYKDPAATKIFDRGTRLYPIDEWFALEHLKHLIAINDVTNARAVFETTVSRLTSKPETLNKAKALYAFFHDYESRYGELNQIMSLEKRMADLWPDEQQPPRFSQRFSAPNFDPTTARPIISPATQMKPLTQSHPSVEEPLSAKNSPRTAVMNFPGTASSPKRPFAHDDSDNELLPPHKLARGESPLKGAAGRRLDASRRTHGQTTSAAYPRLPAELNFLLSIIPNASSMDTFPKFKAEPLVDILRTVDLSRANLAARAR